MTGLFSNSSKAPLLVLISIYRSCANLMFAAFLGLALCLFGVTSDADATIELGFDDVGVGNNIDVPNGYGGLNWGTELGESPLWFDKSNGVFLDGVVSPEYAAIFGTSTHTISNPVGTFDFVGAYFTGGWYDKTATVKGFLNGVETNSTTVFAQNGSATWYQFDWTGIDTLLFPVIDDGGSPGNNDDYVVDNFTINNVPEPTSLALFGIAMLGLSRLRRLKLK